MRYYLEDGKGMVKGFFKINFKNNLPHLQHFYIDPKHRSPINLRLLAKVFINKVRELGYKTAYIHACTERQEKFIQYYFKKEPCGIKDNIVWFLVNIGESHV